MGGKGSIGGLEDNGQLLGFYDSQANVFYYISLEQLKG